MRQIGPLLALAPVRKRRIDSVAIVDGTLVLNRDHRLAAPSKNYRYSANVQVAIDADIRLVIATGDRQPGNRNDCTAYRDSGIKDAVDDRPVMTDGGYQGNPEVIMPYRKALGCVDMDLGRLLSYQGLHYVPSTDTPKINWSVQQPRTYKPYLPTHPDQDETVQ